MVEPTLELRPETIASVAANLRARAAAVRTWLPNPHAEHARSIWNQIDRGIERERDARSEAIARLRAETRAPESAVDPMLTDILQLASSVQADSWTRVRALEARAGAHAPRVTIDRAPRPARPQPRAADAYVAVVIHELERAERAYMEVALGDLHVPVRYVRPGDDCSGALAIVDADWFGISRSTPLYRFGRPIVVAATSGAHESQLASAIYDPLFPEMLAEAIRAVMRLA